MGVFAYVIPLTSDNNCIIICIDLVLLMVWVESPKFFSTLSETLTDVANTFVNKLLPVLGYRVISKIPKTDTGPPHTLDILTHIYCYMYD